MNKTARIAENHICVSRALFREGIHAAENKDYARSVRKIAFCIVSVFAAAAAWLLYTGGSLVFLLGEAVFLGALLFWLMFMLPNTRRHRQYKAMMHGTGCVPERTTVFYPEHLSVTANHGSETVIPYDNIINWQETKHLYILNCMNNTSILLDKHGFVCGDFHTVVTALKSENI